MRRCSDSAKGSTFDAGGNVTTRTSTTAVASNLEGASVNISAGQDLNVKGSNVLADQDVNLQAGGNVNITAVSCPSVRDTFVAQLQARFFQREAAWGCF